ncbi:MAG: hypothetical protein ACK5LX_00675 [Oscillospiraceae bacterium]
MGQQKTGSSNPQREIDRMEQEIGRLEHTLRESYSDAGKMILEAAETESRKINELVDRIVEMRRQLLELRGDRECPECGTYNKNHSLYCNHCGSKLDKAGPDEESAAAFAWNREEKAK